MKAKQYGTIVIVSDLESTKKVDYRKEYPDCHVIGCEDAFSGDVDVVFSYDTDRQQEILKSGFCKSGVCNFMGSRPLAPPEKGYFGDGPDDMVVLLEEMPPMVTVQSYAFLIAYEICPDKIVMIGSGAEKAIEELRDTFGGSEIIER